MFKRIVAFLLSMLLIVPVASADTNDEIVFHGIPWGISINELVVQLQERKIPVSYSDIDAGSDMRFWGSQFISLTEDHFDSAGHMISLYDYDDRIVIAGHPVRNIDLYAHYGIVDGEISLDSDDSEYYLCTIMFAAGDDMIEEVYSDLLTKLSNLYGDSIVGSTTTSSNEYKHAVWNGNNNTAVMLYCGAGKYKYVCLMYGKTNSEDTLREVRQLVIEYQIQSVTNDSTGL